MYKNGILIAVVFAAGISAGVVGNGMVSAASGPPVKVENLLRTELEVSGELEVIMSLVEIGANASLPRHHHPGEEFIYVLEGSSTLWQKGKADTLLKAGDAYRIPLEQVHTAITGAESTRAIVFRVHRKGMPDRIAE